jgi:Negative regulator of sigma F
VTTIPALIDMLVNRASPVRRLRPPLLRASLWLAFAAVVLAPLAFEHGLRSDLAEQLRQPTFALGLGAAATTGILSAIAAFAISIPDRSRWWLLLPAPALVVWVGTISYGCFADWVSIGPDGLNLPLALQRP